MGNVSNLPKTLNVMLVDDDPDHRWLMRDALELAGLPCKVQEVGRADVALQQLQAALLVHTPLPDVIYCDVEMPGTSGLALVKTVKSNPKCDGIWVVVVTGSGTREELEPLARLAGADAFVQKSRHLESFSREIQDSLQIRKERRQHGGVM